MVHGLQHYRLTLYALLQSVPEGQIRFLTKPAVVGEGAAAAIASPGDGEEELMVWMRELAPGREGAAPWTHVLQQCTSVRYTNVAMIQYLLPVLPGLHEHLIAIQVL